MIMMTLNEDTTLLEEVNNSSVTLDEHSEDIDKSVTIDCDWLPCDFKSTDKGLLINHIDKHIGNQNKVQNLPSMEDAPSCNLCDFDSDSQTDLEQHCRIIHGQNIVFPLKKTEKAKPKPVLASVEEEEPLLRETVFICGNCAKGFHTENGTLKHMESHIEYSGFRCETCDLTFSIHLDLEWHIETQHEQDIDDQAKEHKKTATPVESKVGISCPFCHLESKDEEFRKVHIQNIHITGKKL